MVIVNINCMIDEELCVSDQTSLNTKTERNDKNIFGFQFKRIQGPNVCEIND